MISFETDKTNINYQTVSWSNNILNDNRIYWLIDNLNHYSMKKLVISLMFITSLFSIASAQVRYKEFFETGASTIVGEHHGFSFQLDNSHGFQLGSSFIGIGYGFDTYELLKGGRRDMNKTIPVFLNYKYFNEEKRISGFVDLKAGIIAMINDDNFGGGFLEGGAGGRLNTKGRSALSASLFYRRTALPFHNGCDVILQSLNVVGFKLALDL